jgi:serine protease Do
MTVASLAVLLALTGQTPDVAAAVARVRPAVVSIEVHMIRSNSRVSDAAYPVRQVRALGSGFVFRSDGYVLTCNHVIAGYEEIAVEFADGTRYGPNEVEVTGRDPVTDIAVLKLSGAGSFPVAEPADSDSLRVGQWVAAVGNPFGLRGSATVGIVSGLSRWGLRKSSGPDFQDFVQTDALINPGNSGGPLIDLRGRVVGVSSFGKTIRGDLTGIGFATPINLARAVADQLVEHGKMIRGYLGVNTQVVTDAVRRALGIDSTTGGVLVASVARDRPGDRAGIRPGDALLVLDGDSIPDVRWFQDALSGRAPGDSVMVGLFRQGRTLAVRVELEAWPVVGTDPKTAPDFENWLGLVVSDLDAGVRASSGVTLGVVVDALEPASPADEVEIKVGDVIVEINFAPVRNRKTFDHIAEMMDEYERPVLVRLLRGRVPYYVAIEP